MPLEPGARFGSYSTAGVLLVALTALSGCSQTQPNQASCSKAVQVLSSAALAHIAEAHDLPDWGLVAADRPILVSNFITELNCELQDDVLPTPSELPFELATPVQLQSTANTEGRVQYVEVSDARVFNDTQASINVGVGMLLAEDSDQALLCCCSGEARFRNTENEWVFTWWASSVCS